MKIVEVSWLDTVSRHSWMPPDAAEAWLDDDSDGHNGLLYKYVGYLFKVTPEYIAIVGAHSSHENGTVNDLTQFPRAIVVEVRDVKTGRKVKLP